MTKECDVLTWNNSGSTSGFRGRWPPTSPNRLFHILLRNITQNSIHNNKNMNNSITDAAISAQNTYIHTYIHTCIHTYIQTNLYSAKIVETNQRCWRRVTRQSKQTGRSVTLVDAWTLSLSIERICWGKEFQVHNAETEKEREEKWLATPVCIARRYVLEERSVRAGT